jgi:hypothetical protein
VKTDHQAQVEKVAATAERAVDKAESNLFKRLDAIEARLAEAGRATGEQATRSMLGDLERNIRVEMTKIELDGRLRAEKVEGDLRQRIDAEAVARADALKPLTAWMQRSGGQSGVWVAVAGVAVTVILAAVIFMANWATR